MPQTYFLATPAGQRGPFPMSELLAQGLTPDMLVWAEGMPEWVPARSQPDLAGLFQGMPRPSVAPPVFATMPPSNYAGVSPSVGSDKKVIAGIMGILLGSLGVHKFILGYTGTGFIMLLITVCTCFVASPVMHLIGFIEGIIYLSKSDGEFAQTYVYGRKTWF